MILREIVIKNIFNTILLPSSPRKFHPNTFSRYSTTLYSLHNNFALRASQRFPLSCTCFGTSLLYFIHSAIVLVTRFFPSPASARWILKSPRPEWWLKGRVKPCALNGLHCYYLEYRLVFRRENVQRYIYFTFHSLLLWYQTSNTANWCQMGFSLL